MASKDSKKLVSENVKVANHGDIKIEEAKGKIITYSVYARIKNDFD